MFSREHRCSRLAPFDKGCQTRSDARCLASLYIISIAHPLPPLLSLIRSLTFEFEKHDEFLSSLHTFIRRICVPFPFRIIE